MTTKELMEMFELTIKYIKESCEVAQLKNQQTMLAHPDIADTYKYENAGIDKCLSIINSTYDNLEYFKSRNEVDNG